jgi:hypothetical protein
MKYFEVVNFEKYQSTGKTKDWVKIWKKIINDFNFCKLSNGERWIFIGLIILASDNNNCMPWEDGGKIVGRQWVYQRVAKGEPKGSYRVGIGMKKMLKIGLIRVKNAIIEKSREEKIRKEESVSFNKPYYKPTGEKMWFDKAAGKWWVIKGKDDFSEFAGKKEDIVSK